MTLLNFITSNEVPVLKAVCFELKYRYRTEVDKLSKNIPMVN